MSLSAAHIVARGPLSLPDAPPRSRYPRTNVLQLPQIHRELASLSANLSRTRSVIDAHDARLLEARRRAVAEMVETRREEGMCMEGVELELAEGEQGVLLSGALEVLERHEGKGGLHHHHDHERKVVDDVDGNEAPDVGTTTTTTIVTRRRRRTENKVQTDPILMHTGDVYKTAPHMPHRFKRPALWRYEIHRSHPLYRTTASDYGNLHPSVHEMPTGFHGQSSKFTKHLNQAGPYRNFSLNTSSTS